MKWALQWSGVFAVSIVLASFHPILINLAMNDGKILFSSASVALLIEAVKLLISSILLVSSLIHGHHLQFPPLKVVALYAIPSILYAINNNLVTHCQRFMDPASFQVMNNLKIGATAICYKLIINKPIKQLQWIAIGILFCAGLINSLSGLAAASHKAVQVGHLYITVTGIALVTLYSFISALAGVYTEAVLKKYKHTSIHLQNGILYLFGSMINSWIFLIGSWNAPVHAQFAFFSGYSIWTWAIIFSQAANGIIISVVMKYSSNIARLFVVAASMIVTSVLSFMIFGFSLNWHFALAFGLVMLASCLYHVGGDGRGREILIGSRLMSPSSLAPSLLYQV